MKKLALLLSLISPLAAVDLTVTIACSNGKTVPNLPVTVYDSTGEKVSGISRSNSQGVFVIQNSETYTEPFHMFFTAQNGSMCGSYTVMQEGTVGRVVLNYYPTDLPCSCSHY